MPSSFLVLRTVGTQAEPSKAWLCGDSERFQPGTDVIGPLGDT